MEGRDFLLDPDINQLEELVLPKWTAVPSILYALSILVKCETLFYSSFLIEFKNRRHLSHVIIYMTKAI